MVEPKSIHFKIDATCKGDPSGCTNQNRLTKKQFNWQEAYGAFSVEKDDIDSVVKYIMNQKKHHKAVTLQEKYHKILTDYGVEFDVRYTFKPLAD